MYDVAPDSVRDAARHRVVTMRHSDAWVDGGCGQDDPLLAAVRPVPGDTASPPFSPAGRPRADRRDELDRFVRPSAMPSAGGIAQRRGAAHNRRNGQDQDREGPKRGFTMRDVRCEQPTGQQVLR